MDERIQPHLPHPAAEDADTPVFENDPVLTLDDSSMVGLNGEDKIEKRKPEYLLFSELDNTERNILRKRIEKFNGLIRIFVHPYFEDHPYDADGTNDNMEVKLLRKHQLDYIGLNKKHESVESKKEMIKKVLIDLANRDPDKTPAFLIFEEEKNISRLMDILEREQGSNFHSKFYIVATKSMSGEITDEIKDKVIGNLGAIGAKSFLVAGNYLEKDENTSKFIGCVANVLSQLEDVGEVKLSSLVYPYQKSGQGW